MGKGSQRRKTEQERWDAKCHRCGKCCYYKHVNEDGTYTPLDTHCPYLDSETKQCTIFENRQEINPSCIQLDKENVKFFLWLPEDCAYRKR